MMENYQETCNTSDQMEQLDVICQTNIVEMQNCETVMSNEENYNFGAEITKSDVNNEIKTTKTVENITSTKTEETISAPKSACATTTTIIASVESARCNYDTSDDIGEDEADDENYDSPDEDSSQYAQNAQQTQDGTTGSFGSSDDDTNTSTDSDFSDISGLSDVSGKEWKPVNRKPILWVQKQIYSGRNPRELLSRFLPAGAQSIALGLNDMSLWRLLANMLSEPPRRQKLRHVNTFEDIIKLILNSKNIVVLTGAGVSVSCGIPDFRSSDGIYSRLAKDYPNLPDPQAMFDIDYFSRDPRPFYKFAREIYPGQFKPSPCHRFIKLLEEKQRLLRNYTQNIDTLEQVAGIQRVIECHGSFSTASCTKCKYKCNADAIRGDIFAQRIPVCPLCQPNVHQSLDASEPVSEYDLRWLVANGIMKPDIVFFGEGLPDAFHKVMASDKDKCDLLIVIGSSLKVRPVALIPSSLPANVPQILINRERLNHLEFDVELLGDSDVIINQICHRLGDDWKQICFDERILKESKELQSTNEVYTDDDDYVDDEEVAKIVDVDDKPINEHYLAEFNNTTTANAIYSDSGFESSTSMCQTECKLATTLNTVNDDDLVKIENIKTSILEFNEQPNASDDNDFQPFSVRLGQDTLMMTPPTTNGNFVVANGENLRHLSIDSTKDSGIQCCDSSNSMATNTTVYAELNEVACSSTSSIALKTAKKPQTLELKSQTDTGIKELIVKKRYKSKSCSVAELLLDGTYFYHKNSSSYIFPGAQITCYDDYSDTDEENCQEEKFENVNEKHEDHEEHEGHEEYNTTLNGDTNETSSNQYNTVAPFKGVCCHDITKTNTNLVGSKRSSTDNLDSNTSLKVDEFNKIEPPIKKCRINTECSEKETILTTTINTSTCCNKATNLNRFESSTTTSSRTTTITATTEIMHDI